MSILSRENTHHKVNCQYNYCDQIGLYHEYYKNKYCTEDCYHQEHARKILSDFVPDHKYCASCGVKLKTIERPPETVHDCVIGFQYPTPEASSGEKTTASGLVRVGLICGACGTTDQRDSYLRRLFFTDFCENLCWYVNQEIEDYALTISDLEYELYKGDRCVRFELALGRALNKP